MCYKVQHKVIKMGDNVESDLLYEDFQNEDQKEFNNVSTKYLFIRSHFAKLKMLIKAKQHVYLVLYLIIIHNIKLQNSFLKDFGATKT